MKGVPTPATLQARDGSHWFDVKVIDERAGAVKIHFVGWKKKYDRWINNESSELREKPAALDGMLESGATCQPMRRRGRRRGGRRGGRRGSTDELLHFKDV